MLPGCADLPLASGLEEMLRLKAPQSPEDQHPSDFLGSEEKSLLNTLIGGNCVAPEVTDASSGNHIGKGQPIDDVGYQFGSGKDGLRGGLSCLSRHDFGV